LCHDVEILRAIYVDFVPQKVASTSNIEKRSTMVTLGVGAVCSVVVQYLHPSKLIKDKYPSRGAKERLENLLAIRRETLKVNKVQRVCVVFRHDDFPNQELHCCERWARVDQEGPADSFFDIVPEEVTVEEMEEGRELPQEVNTAASIVHLEDALLLRAEGFDVDDDNDPAPENIPIPGEVIQDTQEWGWSSICNRKAALMSNSLPKLLNKSDSEVASMTIMTLFLLLFPLTYLHEVLLIQLNKNLQKQGERACGFGEFLRFLGIMFYMSTFKGFTRQQYWSYKDLDKFDGAPVRFHEWMSKRRFDMILGCLDYTDKPRPAYNDKFHGVRQLIDAWNSNMTATFLPSWVSCLDESMSPWTTRHTCPGWMFVPRKPKPFGNEYHSVCCGLSGLMWGVELVEGKDSPPESRVPEPFGKTCGLLLRMCQPIVGRGMVVILDSGFCVLKGLVELKKIGVFASAVIKKRRYWPKHVPGDDMDLHMSTKEVGDVDSLRGTMDGINYDLFCMKDTDYTMKLMSTYGALLPSAEAPDKYRVIDGNTKTIKYTEPFENHYLYRHAVDDHNNLRHSDISLEETWVTHRWENRVFAFILAITEVNVYLAMRFFVWRCGNKVPVTFIQFRRQLAKALIKNDHMTVEEEDNTPRKSSKRLKQQRGHDKLVAPNHARSYDGSKWILAAMDRYQKYTCRTDGCQKLIRTYCSCTPGHWMCDDCYVRHRVKVVKDEEQDQPE
jgi:Transposase IS4